MNTPPMARLVIVSKNGHCISRLKISPVNPISELNAIINNDVPVATFMGSPVKSTSAGIIKKPPPAPTSPVSKPIMIPRTRT